MQENPQEERYERVYEIYPLTFEPLSCEDYVVWLKKESWLSDDIPYLLLGIDPKIGRSYPEMFENVVIDDPSTGKSLAMWEAWEFVIDQWYGEGEHVLPKSFIDLMVAEEKPFRLSLLSACEVVFEGLPWKSYVRDLLDGSPYIKKLSECIKIKKEPS